MGSGFTPRLGKATLLAVFVWATPLQAQQSDNLLKLSTTKIVATTSASSLSKLALLCDGDERTVVNLISSDESIDVVFEMGQFAVTAEQLRVRFGRVTAAVKVQLLVSLAAADSGYSVVRADVLAPSARAIPLSFQATAARWVMIRFTPAEKGRAIEIAELELWGSRSAPSTKYEFAESPAKTLDVLTSLKTSKELAVKLNRDELSLFEDAQDGKFDSWTFAEAALMSSGVHDPRKRSSYLKEIDQLEEEARRVTHSASSDFEKADQLLTWMHSKSGPLSNGYRADQTDLSVVLDTGTFNCVSSATLYNILGRRLGLDVRAIEVPDHAFSILYEGRRFADVETTNAHGFNPARDQEAQKQFERQTGFRYIPDRHRDRRREINEAGLVAVTYYNHGVTLSKKGKYQAALLEYFRAMSLDPEFKSSIKNALAAMVNWGLELAQNGDYEQAVQVIETGLKLAPEDASLTHNRKVTYTQWALALADIGDDSQALAVLRRAAAEIADEHFNLLQATIFVRRGEALLKDGRWEAAWEAVEPGVTAVQRDARQRLLDWQRNFFLRWSNAELRDGRHHSAVNILARGLKRIPHEPDFTNNLAFVIQSGARDIQKSKGNAAAFEFLSIQCTRFAKLPAVAAVARSHAKRVYFDRRGKGEFEDAIAAIADFSQYFVDDGERNDLVADGYSSWAISLTKANRWQAAIDVLATGLDACPNHDGIRKNLAYVIQQWSKHSHKTSGVEKTNEILQQQVNRFGGEEKIAEIALGYARRVVYDLVDAKKYQLASDAI
ncbi:MAG: tetratricopeptide (TPR) repeat protein [Pirellulaceae bacterium]|jgi:tetratricopeptide (TPR) repeat protein